MRSSKDIGKQRAAPHGNQTKDEASKGIERSEKEGSRAKGGQRLPLIGGKGGVSADEADGNEETPGWVEIGAPAQIGERESDDEAGGEVDKQGAEGKTRCPCGRQSWSRPNSVRWSRARRPKAMSRYFCNVVLLSVKATPRARQAVRHAAQRSAAADCVWCRLILEGSRRDMTPQQDSLSGVIICPAYRRGQRLRVNSFTTTNKTITRRKVSGCQSGAVPGRIEPESSDWEGSFSPGIDLASEIWPESWAAACSPSVPHETGCHLDMPTLR